jgi:diaminopimelate decarboxylase
MARERMITCHTLVYQPFHPSDHGLTCDGVSIESIVERVGTPAYVYSARAVREAYTELDDAFADYPHVIHYALKANSTLAIVRLLRSLGSSVDANSGGEIQVALRAGVQPNDIVFTGVGKTREELEQAIALGVGTINAESPGELDRIAALARAQGTRARVALRVNPDIDAGSHPNISTGLRINKFGVALQDARTIYRERREAEGLRFVGVHIHIGSQITVAAPLRRAAEALVALALELRDDGFALEHLDLGGGLGIPYDDQQTLTARDYARAVVPELKRTGIPVALEPGRAIVGRAGALICRIVDTKAYPDGRRFVVLDAGMSELIRPALYGSFHRIVALTPRQGEPSAYDVVGPICESSDVFARGRMLPPLQVDDLVAVLDTGAYSAVMGSNYNRRLLPPEILVDSGDWTIIRRRQTVDDVLALES